jgi:hypothetical protein
VITHEDGTDSISERFQYTPMMDKVENNTIIWDVTPCNVVEVCRRSAGTHHLHFQDRTTQHHIPNYSTLHCRRCENLKSNNPKQEVLRWTNSIRHGPHRKRHVKQLFYCCACIRCGGNVFTELFPSNDRIFTEPLPRNDRGTTQIDGRDLWSTPLRWLRCHAIHTKFNTD